VVVGRTPKFPSKSRTVYHWANMQDELTWCLWPGYIRYAYYIYPLYLDWSIWVHRSTHAEYNEKKAITGTRNLCPDCGRLFRIATECPFSGQTARLSKCCKARLSSIKKIVTKLFTVIFFNITKFFHGANGSPYRCSVFTVFVYETQQTTRVDQSGQISFSQKIVRSRDRQALWCSLYAA